MISKFAPKREHMLIDKSQITEPLVLIDNTDDYYVTPSGNIYRKYPNGYLKRKTYTSKKNGYIYVTIVERNGKKKSHRLHRIVAKAYIPNPNNYPIVGHKDNIKTNCNVSNLYWTTDSENIQKAVNDGLLVNAKGYEDSQSMPVIAYDAEYNEIARFGSASECSRALHVSKSTVFRHCNHQIKTKTRTGYYFEFQDA